MNLSKEEMVEKLNEVLNGPEVAEQVKIMETVNQIAERYQREMSAIEMEHLDGPGLKHKFFGVVGGIGAFMVTMFSSILLSADPSIIFAWVIATAVGYFAVSRWTFTKELEKREQEAEALQVSPAYINGKKRFAELAEMISEKLGFLVVDYCQPFALSEISRYLRTGLADSLKEALQLYEQNTK